MNDQEKTWEQLIEELVDLRQRVASQDAQLARIQQPEADQRKTNHSLPVLVATAGLDGDYTDVNGHDITEIRQAEDELRRSEATWRSVIENVPAQVGTVDRVGTILFLNRPAPGLTLEKVLGTSVFEYLQPEHCDEARECIEHVFRTGESVVNESVATGPHGTRSWYETRLGPVKVDEKVVAATLVSSDITERKRMEMILRTSEAKYRRLYQSMMDAFVSVDMNGHIQEFNDAYRQMLGYEADELRALTYIDITPQRWHAFEATIVEEQVLKRGYSDIYEKEYRQKNGTLVPVELRTYLLVDDHGQPAAMWAILRDISKRKRAEGELEKANERLEQRVRERTAELTQANELLQAEVTQRRQVENALRQNEAKYRALVESSPDAVGMTDLQGRIVFASQRVAEQFGVSHPDELLGSQATDLVAEEDRDRFRANIHRLIEAGVRRNQEYRGLRKDGTTFAAEISSAVISDDIGNPVALMGVYRDVSERKQAEAALRAKNAELFAAAEIQARLLPQESPQVPGFDIAGRCYPAEAAAGDHFDFLRRPDGSLLVVVGDVSGHGIGPAIVAADFCARLRTLSESSWELSELAAKLNAGLYGETDGEIFVTAILARLDPKSRSLTCLNAGHQPAIVLNSAGETKARLSRGGFPIAILPEASFVAEDSVDLAEGDLILLYTDGLVEAHSRGKPLFGIERAIQIVRENLNRTAREIVETLGRAACQYAGVEGPQDDITLVVVKVLAGSSEASAVLRHLESSEESPAVWDASGKAPYMTGSGHFNAEQCGDVTIVRLLDANYFDRDNYALLQQGLLDFVERQQPDKLAMDLSNVVCLSTALTSTLLIAQKCVQARGGEMKLFGLSQNVLESLQHLQLVGTLFSVYADEITAVRSF